MQSSISRVGLQKKLYLSQSQKLVILTKTPLSKYKSVTARSQSVQVKDQKEYKLQGQESQAFGVPEGYYGPVIQGFLGQAFRLQAGANVYGYKVESTKLNQPKSSTEYALRVGPIQVKENSTVAQFKRPEKTLEIYEFEQCPFCRKVREAIVFLDLDVIFRPSPRQSKINRPKLKEIGGKAQFPYLIDPNSNTQMYESDDIIKYLFNNYGPGEAQIPISLNLGFFTILSAGLAARGVKGTKYMSGKQPNEPLRVWQYEASPFCKPVREVLCDLEIPYLNITVARGSPKRQILFEKRGKFQVPYLEDPNTGVAIFESKQIVEYIEQTYGILNQQ